jgi:hypothetical protein
MNHNQEQNYYDIDTITDNESDNDTEETDQEHIEGRALSFTSSSSTDSFFSYTEEETLSEYDNEEIDSIYNKEVMFLDSEKTFGKYYLGNSFLQDGDFIAGTFISPKTFYQFPYRSVQLYLLLYSSMSEMMQFQNEHPPQLQPPIEILKLEKTAIVLLPDCFIYTLVKKTFWIKIIQRRWKRYFAEKKAILLKRKSIFSLRATELTGKYSMGLNYFPSIVGFMNS